ncbi:nucleotidyltransferase domain-containing protein [Actinoplanes sp. HUAS TT8]|uniref:nucleotidyltransferase domain-containing protein n=1 Tax=Actinoplanes sp. HUAS TT8 TaxID=3447453 RepID=UPI003F51B8B8
MNILDRAADPVHHRLVERERAAALTEEVLTRLIELQQEWPLNLVTEVYVYGSFARGALQPADVDLDIEYDQTGDRWISTVIHALSSGRNPQVEFKKPLVGRKRGIEFAFNNRADADYDMTLLWQRGEDLDTVLTRLRDIKADPTAGRAPRDAMLPQFEGLDRWLPRPYRETLSRAITAELITVERLVLPDTDIDHPLARDHLERRWNPDSPLHRAGRAVFAHLLARGIDPAQVHLHGRDVQNSDTPYFAGFSLRYLTSMQDCLTEHGGTEWIEVIHPTTRGALDALRISPTGKETPRGLLWIDS